MPGPSKRGRRMFGISALLAILALGSAGLWTWTSLRQRGAGSVAKGQSAYDQRDWEHAAILRASD